MFHLSQWPLLCSRAEAAAVSKRSVSCQYLADWAPTAKGRGGQSSYHISYLPPPSPLSSKAWALYSDDKVATSGFTEHFYFLSRSPTAEKPGLRAGLRAGLQPRPTPALCLLPPHPLLPQALTSALTPSQVSTALKGQGLTGSHPGLLQLHMKVMFSKAILLKNK